MFAELECDGGVGLRAGVELYGRELQMVRPHNARVAGIDETTGYEDGYVVLRTEWCELFENAEEFGREVF